MATKKDTKKAATEKPTSAKSKTTKKSSAPGILDKVKDAATEILTSAAQGAALGAINVAAGAVGELLDDGKKKVEKSASTTKSKSTSAKSGGKTAKGK